MAEVISLIAIPAEACPGEEVRVVATTDPPDAIVSWSGLAFDAQVDGNEAITRVFGPGAHTITASLGTSSASVDVTVFGLRVESETGPLAITDEPGMPVITAKAVGIGAPVGQVLEWTVSVSFRGDDCPPSGTTDSSTDFQFQHSSTAPEITLDFGDTIRGGGVTVTARAEVGGCELSASGGPGLVGTNPQRSEIQAALPHNTLRAIACWESGQRQFNAPPDGGTDFCPLFRKGGKVGIMGLRDPTDDEVWNWRLNVAKGVSLFEDIVTSARDYPSRVRGSAEFQSLVERFNERRQAEGLDTLSIALPEYSSGNFDDDLRQLELDTIRGYDGWHGQDRFGFELHEFRVGVDVVDGEEMLRVVNIDEPALRGEAEWEQVPVLDRPVGGGDALYVESVIAFLGGCTSDTAPQNSCGIEIVTRGPSLSFSPPSTSGIEVLEARTNVPLVDDVTAAWYAYNSAELTGEVQLDASDPLKPTIKAMKPNRVRVLVRVAGTGRLLCLDYVDISVPQFFQVVFRDEFQFELERLGLRRRPPQGGTALTPAQQETNQKVELAVKETILETVRKNFERINVRFMESAPPQAVPADSVTVAFIGGLAPSDSPENSDLLGVCYRPIYGQRNARSIDRGNLVPQQTIEIWSGAFTNRDLNIFETLEQKTIYLDIFDELAIEDVNGNPLVEGNPVDAGEHPGGLVTDPQQQRRQRYVAAAILAFGRMIGTVLSHECGHALGLDHTPFRAQRIMDERHSFLELTGIEAFDPTTGQMETTDPVRFDQETSLAELKRILPILS